MAKLVGCCTSAWRAAGKAVITWWPEHTATRSGNPLDQAMRPQQPQPSPTAVICRRRFAASNADTV